MSKLKVKHLYAYLAQLMDEGKGNSSIVVDISSDYLINEEGFLLDDEEALCYDEDVLTLRPRFSVSQNPFLKFCGRAFAVFVLISMLIILISEGVFLFRKV